MGAAWTDERKATCKRLYEEGKSASEIARELGDVTRNAVIGAIHRSGYRRAPDAVKQAQRIAKRATAPSAIAIPPVTSARTPGASLQALVAVTLRPSTDLGLPPPTETLTATVRHAGRGECRWPIGDPQADDYGCCGRAASGRYCATHEAMGRSPRQFKRTIDSVATHCTRNERVERKPPSPRPLGILGDRWAPDW